MAGWRVEMLIGREEYLNDVLRVKTQMDSGIIGGIQKGAIEALKLDRNWFHKINTIYKDRRELVWRIAKNSIVATIPIHRECLCGLVGCQRSKNAETMVDELLYSKNIFVAFSSIF